MANLLGKHFSVHIFGQSHAPSIGAVIEGLPAGFTPDWEKVHAFMARRAPGTSAMATARKEADMPIVLSGLNEKGQTCGAPLAVEIKNGDHHSSDYDQLKALPRPGHADYTAFLKYAAANDIRGGGQFSGRLTAPLCFAGALAMQLLEEKGIQVKARIHSIAGIEDAPMNACAPALDAIASSGLSVVNPDAGKRMEAAVLEAKTRGDSVGGIIECYATGLPAGLGDPMFDGVENLLARALFGIPAVRGVEFGTGFAAAGMTGSEHNDAFLMEDGNVKTATNHHGGILGGITTGMPLVVRIAIKPTPSIAMEQNTVDLRTGENASLVIKGRHDPCIVPRAVPVMEAAVACVLYDLIAK